MTSGFGGFGGAGIVIAGFFFGGAACLALIAASYSRSRTLEPKEPTGFVLVFYFAPAAELARFVADGSDDAAVGAAVLPV